MSGEPNSHPGADGGDWGGWTPESERAELQAYLGDAYDEARLRTYQAQLEVEVREIADEQRLYRVSEAYLYNLTAFAMTRTKLPYLEWVLRELPAGASVLDYGCGVGSDGLMLMAAGYDVTFADFDNPSTRYLKWRLERRGQSADVLDLDAGPVPAGAFDLAYAFDVIEHVDDPWGFLGRMEEAAGLVLVNFLEADEGDTELHRELPIASLVAHARVRGLLRYRRFCDGRSHLVLYGDASVLRSWRAWTAGRLRAG